MEREKGGWILEKGTILGCPRKNNKGRKLLVWPRKGVQVTIASTEKQKERRAEGAFVIPRSLPHFRPCAASSIYLLHTTGPREKLPYVPAASPRTPSSFSLFKILCFVLTQFDDYSPGFFLPNSESGSIPARYTKYKQKTVGVCIWIGEKCSH